MPSPTTNPPSPSPPPLHPLLTLPPPTPTRAWLTAPHPTLPLLATCHADRTVRITSLTTTPTPRLISTISGGHKRSIRSCAWKPGLNPQTREQVVVTGSFDASVGVWRTWALGSGGSGGGGKKVRGTEVGGEEEEGDEDEEWAFALVLDGHDSEVKSVSFCAGGHLLATSSRDKSVWVWEEVGEDEWETVAVLQEHEGDVKCVAWHPEEEALASGSYDEEIRVWREEGGEDWGCVAVLRGHAGTVWWVAWEGVRVRVRGEGERDRKGVGEWMERREKAGPRLLSASADGTVRVWRRVPGEKVMQSKLSIIRSRSGEEEWVQEAVLPKVHTQAVYAVGWGKEGGRVVSGGEDGTVAVYEERWVEGGEGTGTEWVVVGRVVAAHGVFEVNHVTWIARRMVGKGGEEKKEGKKEDGVEEEEEECVVSTGDDGCVKVWALKA